MILALLLLAALVGGAANALAGGGQFIVFPALLWTGLASVKANATSSFVVLPGGIAAAWVYRRTVVETPRPLLSGLITVSLAGSLAGAVLLLHTANATFSAMVPWLLLISASVFTAAPLLRKAGESIGESGRRATPGSTIWLLIGQFIIAVYGGYFGAGMGVLMIALFLAAANMKVQSASGIRLICATAINVPAVVLFASRGAVDWKTGLPMLAAGVTGGYISARLMRRMSEETARNAILAYAWVLTIYFFVR